MLVVSQGVDGGNAAETGEFFDVLLSEGADDGAVDHASEHPGGVANGLAASQLDVVRIEEEYLGPEFAKSHLETDPGAGGGFTEDQGPGLSVERACVRGARGLEPSHAVQDGTHVGGGQGFETQQVFHDSASPAEAGKRFCKGNPRGSVTSYLAKGDGHRV